MKVPSGLIGSSQLGAWVVHASSTRINDTNLESAFLTIAVSSWRTIT